MRASLGVKISLLDGPTERLVCGTGDGCSRVLGEVTLAMGCLGAAAMVVRGVRSARLVLGALTVVALAAVGAVLWATTAGPAAGVRVFQSPPSGAEGNQARAYALALLAKLELPAGAQRAAWPARPGRLPQLFLPFWRADVVTAQALYRVGASTTSVSQFLTGHLPAGMQPRWEDPYGAGSNDRHVLDVPSHLPQGIAHANLAVVIIPRGSGSLIHAEAQVVWYPPRSTAEFIHLGRYRAVTVTVPAASGASRDGTVTRTFTSRAVIAELASLLNRLPGMLPTAFSCPAMAGGFAPSPYRLVFTPRSRRWPTIAAAPVGCWDGGILVGKHRQPALDFSRDKIIPVMLALMGQQAESGPR
jgi:hypothetical protein